MKPKALQQAESAAVRKLNPPESTQPLLSRLCPELSDSRSPPTSRAPKVERTPNRNVDPPDWNGKVARGQYLAVDQFATAGSRRDGPPELTGSVLKPQRRAVADCVSVTRKTESKFWALVVEEESGIEATDLEER